jgi:hypothetical protein
MQYKGLFTIRRKCCGSAVYLKSWARIDSQIGSLYKFWDMFLMVAT